MLLLKQKSSKKEQVNEKVIELKFEAGNSKKYKVEAIQDSTIYTNKAKSHLLGFYYLIAQKN